MLFSLKINVINIIFFNKYSLFSEHIFLEKEIKVKSMSYKCQQNKKYASLQIDIQRE